MTDAFEHYDKIRAAKYGSWLKCIDEVPLGGTRRLPAGTLIRVMWTMHGVDGLYDDAGVVRRVNISESQFNSLEIVEQSETKS